MPRPWFCRTLVFTVLALALQGCEGPVSPEAGPMPPGPGSTYVPGDSLHMLRFASDAPPLSDTLVTFWAVVGEYRGVEIRYQPQGDYGGGTCLYFAVPGDALLRHPDGSTFGSGDSVQITIRVVNGLDYNFEFSPAGLEFDPESPAQLRLYHYWADPDYNGDGRIDHQDAAIHERFGLWKQEHAGAGWLAQPTVRDDVVSRATADILGFTRYALASN